MDITTYDTIVINSSGGKDSQAMLDYMVELADAQGVDRDKLIVVHADLGRAEWDGVKGLAQRQASHYGLRFTAVHRTQGDLLDHIEQRGMFPSSTARYCTSDHKRAQVNRVLTSEARKIADEIDGPVRILNTMGIRAQESKARAKKAPFENNARATGKGRVKIVDNWFPIFDWSEADVWNRIKASGVEHHFAYDLGMPRLSCVFCIFAPKSALLIAGEHNPKLLDEYVRIEKKIGHDFKHGFRIAEIKASLAAGERGKVSGEDAAQWCM